jgi:hypothetical protein
MKSASSRRVFYYLHLPSHLDVIIGKVTLSGSFRNLESDDFVTLADLSRDHIKKRCKIVFLYGCCGEVFSPFQIQQLRSLPFA